MDKVKKFFEGGIREGIGETYDTHRECETNPSKCEDICRCGKIQNVQFKGIDFMVILQGFVKGKLGLTPHDLYALDRLFRLRKLYLEENWEPLIEPGYYGEEFGGWKLKREVFAKLEKDLEELKTRTKDDRIRYTLIEEYGYLLPILKEGSFVVREVPSHDIHLQAEDHYVRVKHEPLPEYEPKKYQCPRGICVPLPTGKYRLIDGYHRVTQAISQSKVMIWCLVPSSQGVSPIAHDKK